MDKYQRRLEADLKVAERVHRSMIPASRREGDFEISCEFIPMIGVGGDYASVYFQSDRRCVVGICDVMGHGVASALLATRVNSFVLSQAPSVRHPCQLVEALNEFIYRTFRETDLSLTFFSLFIDLETKTVVGSGCGHPPVLVYDNQNHVVQRLQSENTIIGLFEDLSSTCSMLEIPFTRGDQLLLYTDGLTESTNQAGVHSVLMVWNDISRNRRICHQADASKRSVAGFATSERDVQPTMTSWCSRYPMSTTPSSLEPGQVVVQTLEPPAPPEVKPTAAGSTLDGPPARGTDSERCSVRARSG